MTFSLGCAVWAYKGWVGEIYPAGTKSQDFLSVYASRFGAVEGNTTFYAVPDEDTLRRWADAMPPGFRFLPKVPREITHGGGLVDKLPELYRFIEHMRALGDRLGPFHLQLPPDCGPDQLPELATFLTRWPLDEAALVVELRHPGFFYEPEATQLDRLLERLGAGRVILDTRPVYQCPDDPQASATRRKPALPLRVAATSDLVMIRFVNHPERARNLPWLRAWAPQVHQWLDEGRHVYFFSHCPEEEHSPAMAAAFHALLEARGAPVEPLGWAPPPQVTQQRLF